MEAVKCLLFILFAASTVSASHLFDRRSKLNSGLNPLVLNDMISVPNENVNVNKLPISFLWQLTHSGPMYTDDIDNILQAIETFLRAGKQRPNIPTYPTFPTYPTYPSNVPYPSSAPSFPSYPTIPNCKEKCLDCERCLLNQKTICEDLLSTQNPTSKPPFTFPTQRPPFTFPTIPSTTLRPWMTTKTPSGGLSSSKKRNTYEGYWRTHYLDYNLFQWPGAHTTNNSPWTYPLLDV